MPKKTKAGAAKTKPRSKINPFKTRKTREPAPDTGDTLTPPDEVAEAVDAFRESQEQMKHYEGEATIHKNEIMDYGAAEFAKRAIAGKTKSFKILGEQSMVTFVAMDASAGLSEEEVEHFVERWGKKAAEDLITKDLGSIRFDPEVLEANYDAVVEALQEALPEKVLENLFRPLLMKAKPGAVEKAKQFAKNAEELRELIQQLKIRNYIR